MPKQQPPWEPWLYDLWGPEHTGRPARDTAIAANHERYRRAEEWRLAREKPTTDTAEAAE